METVRVFAADNEIFPDEKGEYAVSLGDHIRFVISKNQTLGHNVYLFINDDRADYSFTSDELEISKIDNFFSRRLENETPIRFNPNSENISYYLAVPGKGALVKLYKDKMMVSIYVADRILPVDTGSDLPYGKGSTVYQDPSRNIFQAYFVSVNQS